jgi:adenosylcobyric acid synthase
VTARVLMVQGTMSSVGKSLLVTGLCRLYTKRGLRVAPFKAQNMSNNAAVCVDGSEIGRAQYTQALACGIEPQALMNPILLKPEADHRSQVIVMGRTRATLAARDYYQMKAELWPIITDALDELRRTNDLVIIEGAGSPVELNLKQGDLVNMRVAQYAQAPVVLVGDIDRGGIFAQLLGTLSLLEPEERQLVQSLIVNKFRGDPALFVDGIRILEEQAEIPVAGVIAYLHHAIPEEDSVALETRHSPASSADAIDIAIIQLPRIANFDDFDPLVREPDVAVRYVSSAGELGKPNAVILPGTKSTIADLDWLAQQGLVDSIQNFARHGGAVVGICGGYQMLGHVIRDPGHIESSNEQVAALGLLPLETTFLTSKATYQVQARICRNNPRWLSHLTGQRIKGYEIHMGVTGTNRAAAWLEITDRNDEPVSILDGAISPDGRVWGCYLHGLFANSALRRGWLQSLGWKPRLAGDTLTTQSADFDVLAHHLESHMNMDQLDTVLPPS